MADLEAIQSRLHDVKNEIAEKTTQDATFRSALLSDLGGTIERNTALKPGH